MQRNVIRLLAVLICGMSIAVSAAAKSIHVEWGFTPPTEPTVTGFKLYQEGSAVCQTQDPNATAMDCEVTLTAATTNFTLTATFSDGTESPHSSPFAYVSSDFSPPEDGITDTLQAVIEATPLTGTVPVTVNFSAASSTGTVSQYLWDFGDGSVASTNTISHEYTSSGTYTAQLTVTDDAGSSNTATTAITLTASEVTPTPPTAVISSSAAAGPAPLLVSFDGSGSTADSSTSITNYAWSFGDGNTALGAAALHSFTSAGAYTTELAVTASNGLTSSATTPVVVTIAATNVPPKALFDANPDSGSAPLSVSFDGSASSDSDGSVASYTWYFGDGNSGTGQTVTHTYTTEAAFTAVLQVTDDMGATGTSSTTITVQPEATSASLNIETGEIAVTGNWVRVPFSSTFEKPIVIAGPASYNNAEPGVICLRNVNSTGFDIKFNEWDYLDKVHPEETVSYLVMEKGRHSLPDGSLVEAGTFSGSSKWSTVTFSESFTKAPVVMTAIATMNESETISGRVKDISTTGFSYYFREQEKNVNKHVEETVHFIAWEPGEGSLENMQYRVATAAETVPDTWQRFAFPSVYPARPLFLAHMQTTRDIQPSALRMQNLSTTAVEVKVEEEQSKDSEVAHSAESVGYILLIQK
nr:PKD domain-containing protein [uncultured Desulfobulbus sp.]